MNVVVLWQVARAPRDVIPVKQLALRLLRRAAALSPRQRAALAVPTPSSASFAITYN